MAPDAVDLDLGLVDEPPITPDYVGEAGRVGKHRREPRNPPVDGEVIDLDAPFGQQ